MTTHRKPHLSYPDQIALLKSRGMNIPNPGVARDALREYGYYKFSGYFYPLRKPDTSMVANGFSRLNEFVDGVIFDQVVDLIVFDSKLRSILFEGLSTFEVFLRAVVAYVLGEQSPYFHLDETLLHPKNSHQSFLNWLTLYAQDIKNSNHQEFIRHHIKQYNGKLPIWVAVEVMQFGTISSLLSNLRDTDIQKVANEFGFQSRHLFLGLVENLRVLRNDCVHHNRLWNSSLNKHLILQPSHLVHSDLFHLSRLPREKIYIRLVLLSQAIIESKSGTVFKSNLRAHIQDFPLMPLLSPEADMGFPKNWQSLDFWRS